MIRDSTQNENIIKLDCKHFQGDRPCIFHKSKGVRCHNCEHYSKIGNKILIIKLGSIGDVLRTTSILQGLNEKYESPYITWITESESVDLLRNNKYIDRIMEYNAESLARLNIERFDLVINLDVSATSSALASLAKSKEKLGFGLSEQGYIYPFNSEAEEWFKMSLFDDVKKANTKTYQQIMLEIIKIKPKNYDIILNLTKDELKFAEQFAKKESVEKEHPIIGINTGAGNRWQLKKWTLTGFSRLIDRLGEELDAKILLLGGPNEVKRNKELIKNFTEKVIDPCCNNNIREFAALVNLCDVAVTGDTLAMHIAVALKKKTVVLFGPTSAAEIDLYNRGRKIVPDIKCVCCYKQLCEKHPNCMENISVDQVFLAIRDLIE